MYFEPRQLFFQFLLHLLYNKEKKFIVFLRGYHTLLWHQQYSLGVYWGGKCTL